MKFPTVHDVSESLRKHMPCKLEWDAGLLRALRREVLERPVHLTRISKQNNRREVNIRMDLKEIVLEVMDWIRLTQYTVP
jgi:hypothetical protein